MAGGDAMATFTNDMPATEQDGVEHRVARRDSNRRTSARTEADTQSLVEFACECTRVDCERLVKVPLYVYRRMLAADQYLLQAGHHAFPRYRTIISVGLMSIEERS
jgi:hypothetical protein